MSLRAAFQIQRERHDDRSEDEKQAYEERLARKKEEERKRRIKTKIDWMALGYPEGKAPVERRGRPRKLGEYAFNGAMYSDVAKSIFYWTETDSADPEKVHTLLDSEGLYSQTWTVAQEEEERKRKAAGESSNTDRATSG